LGIKVSFSPIETVPYSTFPKITTPLSFILSRMGILIGPFGSLNGSSRLSIVSIRDYPLYQLQVVGATRSFMLSPLSPETGTHETSFTTSYPHLVMKGERAVYISVYLSLLHFTDDSSILLITTINFCIPRLFAN